MSADKPIAVGDLVQVVRGMACCNTQTGSEGYVFTVTDFEGVGDFC